MSKKVLFIGLDGSTFDVLDPLMQKGLMPRLEAFIGEGVRGWLETTIPPITPTAWVSWMTGKNPGKHGVFEFLLRRKGSTAMPDQPVSARARDGLPFWDVLGQMGKRAIVTNMPCTYPPTMVNGVMVADFLINENEHFSSRQTQRVCTGFICSIENCNSAISHRIHA